MEGGVSAEDVAVAHQADGEKKGGSGGDDKRYKGDERAGKMFGLVEPPDTETAMRVDREAHGLVADEIYEVYEGS